MTACTPLEDAGLKLQPAKITKSALHPGSNYFSGAIFQWLTRKEGFPHREMSLFHPLMRTAAVATHSQITQRRAGTITHFGLFIFAQRVKLSDQP